MIQDKFNLYVKGLQGKRPPLPPSRPFCHKDSFQLSNAVMMIPLSHSLFLNNDQKLFSFCSSASCLADVSMGLLFYFGGSSSIKNRKGNPDLRKNLLVYKCLWKRSVVWLGYSHRILFWYESLFYFFKKTKPCKLFFWVHVRRLLYLAFHPNTILSLVVFVFGFSSESSHRCSFPLCFGL